MVINWMETNTKPGSYWALNACGYIQTLTIVLCDQHHYFTDEETEA